MALQGLRNVVHFGSQICWTLAITMLPFATVFALEFTIPAFVALLAVLFLGERMTAHRATALVVCFIGVLVILRPGLGGVPAGHADHDRRRASCSRPPRSPPRS